MSSTATASSAPIMPDEHIKARQSLLQFLKAHTNDITRLIAEIVDGSGARMPVKNNLGELFWKDYALQLRIYTPFESDECLTKVNARKLKNIINNKFESNDLLMGFWLENVTITYDAIGKRLVFGGEINGCE